MDQTKKLMWNLFLNLYERILKADLIIQETR